MLSSKLVTSLPYENLRNMRNFFWRSSRIFVIQTVRLMRRVRIVVLINYDVPKKLFCTLYWSVLLSWSHDLLGCVTMSMIPSRVWNWVNLLALNCFISVMVYCFLVVFCSLIVRCLTHCSLLSISTQLTFASPGRFPFAVANSVLTYSIILEVNCRVARVIYIGPESTYCFCSAKCIIKSAWAILFPRRRSWIHYQILELVCVIKACFEPLKLVNGWRPSRH